MKAKRLTPNERETVKTYDLYAKQWLKTHHGNNFWIPEHEQLKNLLPKGKVLEIGSGGGVDAKKLIKNGYDYTGTDISLNLINQAKKQNPKAHFLNQSVYELTFPEDSFDGFWAVAVLLHIPKLRISEALQKIRSLVKPNGIGLISLKKGEGEKMVEEFFDGKLFRRLYSFYSLNEFSKILRENNFQILASYIRKSTNDTWLIYFVKVIK